MATDEERHVVYEIVVQNVSSHELELDRLKVIDARSGTDVASYRGSSIAHIMVGPEGSTRTLPPGAFGALFIDLRSPCIITSLYVSCTASC